MGKRFRMTILWLAAAFVLAGSAVGFATVGDNHGADVSAVAKPSTTPPTDHGKTVSEVAKTKDAGGSSDGEASSGERKKNHGFYVSAAAHCEDVDDPATATNPDFEAPEGCDSNGREHGKYVSGVAKSSVGKPDKGGEGS